MFENQGLSALNSDRDFTSSERNDQKRELLMNQLLKMEDESQQVMDKYKEQVRINQELADKIQQLEFDKDMIAKENANLKKRELDFGGILNASELEA